MEVRRSVGVCELCHLGFDTVGDLKTQTAEEIWYGKAATRVRRETVNCERLCLITRVSQKTLVEKVKVGARIFGRHTTV